MFARPSTGADRRTCATSASSASRRADVIRPVLADCRFAGRSLGGRACIDWHRVYLTLRDSETSNQK